MKWLLFLKYLLYAKTKAFVGFFTGGIVLWFPFLFVSLDITNWGLVFFVKAAGAVGLAFCTGLSGALGKWVIDYIKANPDQAPRWIKWIRRLFKKKMKKVEPIEEEHKDLYRKNGTYN